MKNSFEIRALLEGAYAQTQTLPGYWINYEEFRTKFNELSASISDVPMDIEKLIREHFPEAQYNENYQLQGSDEVFKAFKIVPDKLICQNNLKRQIEKALQGANYDEYGWTNFAIIGAKGLKPEVQKLGFIGIRQAVVCLFGNRFEFKSGDPSKHEAPVMIRDRKNLEINQDNLTIPASKIASERVRKPKQGSYIGDAINEFAFFPPTIPQTYGWDAAINDLATNQALEERWYFSEEDKITKPILKNYISYTFERLQYEDKQEIQEAQKAKREPKLKILTNDKNAIFNTGLVNSIYEPIYAFFKKNVGPKSEGKQPWMFLAFATANSYWQNIITDFPYRPERARYFNDSTELFYDTEAQKPTLNWQHFIEENIDRLPIGFIKKYAPTRYPFIEDVDELPKPQRESYYKKLTSDIIADDDWYSFLTTKFNNALERTLSRVAWNYKTAIPVYYVEKHQLSLLLPLALEDNNVIDIALVVQHKLDKAKHVNNYVGRTIFTLKMAYTNARLITRPDSDWLMVQMNK